MYLSLKSTGGSRPRGRCQAPLPALQQRQKEQIQWHGAFSLRIMCLWIIFEASPQANGEWMRSLRGLTVLSPSSEESSSPFALPWCSQGGLQVQGRGSTPSNHRLPLQFLETSIPDSCIRSLNCCCFAPAIPSLCSSIVCQHSFFPQEKYLPIGQPSVRAYKPLSRPSRALWRRLSQMESWACSAT